MSHLASQSQLVPRATIWHIFPIFSPFDKWYRISEAKCDEKIHINKRLSRDKDVSLKRIPWWVVDDHTAVILYLFYFRISISCLELCWVKFSLAVAVTAPAKFEIELNVSKWVFVRRRLTDIWGFCSNRDSVAFLEQKFSQSTTLEHKASVWQWDPCLFVKRVERSIKILYVIKALFSSKCWWIVF